MIDYTGKTALITGGASGIGRALALDLARRGATLMLADIQADAVHALAAEIGPAASAVVCDLADPQAPAELVRTAYAHLGRVDLICSNAGRGRNKRVLKEPLDEAAMRLFDLNLFAGIRIAQAYVPELEARGERGRLMLTGSENSLSVPSAVKSFGMGVYGATKHGLLIMAEWLKEEIRENPLDLHVLLPGAVYTPLIAGGIPDPALAPPEIALIMPERCAEIALKGLDLGLFYIPTHVHLAEDMQARSQGVADSLRALGLMA